MDNIADLIVEVLLSEGFELEQIEEFIESEEFDVFTDALLEEIAEEEFLEEGILKTIGKKLPGRAHRMARDAYGKAKKFYASSISDSKKSMSSSDKAEKKALYKSGHNKFLVGKSLSRKARKLDWQGKAPFKNYMKGIKEESENLDEGLTEELLMEIKMKLKPGQKMTPKQFAKMKAEVLAKQKEDKAKKEAKKAAPKQEKKDEKVDTDDTNRNARILKGQFPWGNVSQTLANSALAKLKQIPKPEDRLNAMDAIWDHSKHFHDLIRNGKVDYKKEKEKGKITLPKVKGVTE